MTFYTIELRNEAGVTIETLTRPFAFDDDALDFTGSINHPHQMILKEGGRIVASFSPVRRLRRLDKPSTYRETASKLSRGGWESGQAPRRRASS